MKGNKREENINLYFLLLKSLKSLEQKSLTFSLFLLNLSLFRVYVYKK